MIDLLDEVPAETSTGVDELAGLFGPPVAASSSGVAPSGAPKASTADIMDMFNQPIAQPNTFSSPYRGTSGPIMLPGTPKPSSPAPTTFAPKQNLIPSPGSNGSTPSRPVAPSNNADASKKDPFADLANLF